MTKRRRKKIGKIMFDSTYYYVIHGKFDYLLTQAKLYRKHEAYLCKMNRRLFKKIIAELRKKYIGEQS